MKRAAVGIKEHDGTVELEITTEGEEPTVVVLSPQDARAIGDQMFRAGCNMSL